jgi:MYXO-CTERM domain-containing protein
VPVNSICIETIYFKAKEIQLRRSTTVSALVLAGVIASPMLLHAQANPTSGNDTTMVTDRDEDRSDWGWVGLLGLAGLLGLRRRDREETRDHVRTRQSI